METNKCCESMERELSFWRSKLNDVSTKFDSVPSIWKYKVSNHIEGIHILMSEMDERLETLRKECPTH